MKRVKISILIIFIVTSMSGYASKGLTPVCTRGAFSLVIVNSDVDCYAPKETSYCFFDLALASSSPLNGNKICRNFADTFDKGQTNSISFKDSIPTFVSVGYAVTHYSGSKWVIMPWLTIQYKNGKLTTNCSKIFGTNVSCFISESDEIHHKIYRRTYTLTLRSK